jgi:ribonuclease Z
LLSSFHLLNRDQKLHLYGPPDLEAIINLQLRASQTQLRYPIQFHHTQTKEAEIIFEDSKVTVQSFPLKHSIPTTGFLFEEKVGDRKINSQQVQAHQVPHLAMNLLKKGRDYISESGEVIPNQLLTFPPPPPLKYAFCSDTAYSEKNTTLLQGVDLLYHESTFLATEQALAKKTLHSTASDAAKFAQKIGAGQLLLGHYSVRYEDLQQFDREAQKTFESSIGCREGYRYVVDARNQLQIIPTSR